MTKKVLVVEDERDIRDLLESVLIRSGFEVVKAKNTSEAWETLCSQSVGLILLDWMLPGPSGIEFVKRMQNDDTTKNLPIIMVTAKTEENDKITGLSAGVDDYITKPFSPRELVARINAVMRRLTFERKKKKYEIEGLILDVEGHRVYSDNRIIAMGPTEFKLLKFLMENPERVFSRQQILDHVWGHFIYVEERTVDVHVRRLRKALESTGHQLFIQTVRGAGYRFSVATQAQAL